MPSPEELANMHAPVPKGSVNENNQQPEEMGPAESDLNPWPTVFPAEATGNFSSAKALFKEMNVVDGAMTTFGTPGDDGRQCTDTTDPSGTIALAEKQFFLVEVPDGPDHRYLMLPNPTFLVYLTQNGGADGDDGSTTTEAFPTYTYDVFLDSAKTIKLASTLSVLFHRLLKISVTAATHGLAQWSGTTLILISVDEYVGRDACP